VSEGRNEHATAAPNGYDRAREEIGVGRGLGSAVRQGAARK
jgi:hypothetical protein